NERADLGLRLRDREVERERRNLVCGALVTEKLVPDLRAVPVRDDELGLPEQRRDGGTGLAQVRALLGRRATLACAHERGAARRYDDRHATAAEGEPMRPASASTSSSVGSPISSRRYVTRRAGLSSSISRRRSIGVPIRTRSASERAIVSRSS